MELPDEYSRLHPVFHVERLKRFVPSSVDWPNREQPNRPRAKLEDGKKKYWALRVIGKKEEEVTFTERVEVASEPSAETSSQEDTVRTGSEEVDDVEEKQPSSTRRISPREHASTRATAIPPPLSRAKKAKTRLIKVKRPVVYYKVEWEGYEEGTWHPVEWFTSQDLQWMIDDYEMRERQPTAAADLGTEYTFDAQEAVNGDLELTMMVV